MVTKSGNQAVRQRAALAMGESAGIPAPSGKPRFSKGERVDKTELKKYGNGFRRHGGRGR